MKTCRRLYRIINFLQKNPKTKIMNTKTVMQLLSSIILFASCVNDSPSNIEVVKNFLDAREKKDSVQYMAMVSPHMKVWYEEKKGEGRKWNPNSAWAKWDEHFKPVKTYGEFRADSNAVSVIITETNNFFKLIDRKPAPVQLTWWLNKDRKIEGYMVKSMADSTHTDRLHEFEAWAKKNNPAELNYLMPEGSINPEGDRPQRWEILLKEWRTKINLK
jgi:hypothetical protein